MSESQDAHGSRYVYEILKHKVWLKVLPGLAKQPKGQGLFTVAMIVMAAIGGGFTGYAIYTQIVNPPLDVIGVCPAPAQVEMIGGLGFGVGASPQCVISSSVKNPQTGNVDTVKTPSGYYLLLNGTRYTGPR